MRNSYAEHLEWVIENKLLPIYYKYYYILDQKPPEIPELKELKKQVPALLKKSGDLEFASNSLNGKKKLN